MGGPGRPCHGRAGTAGGFNHGADGSKLVLRLSAACERGCTVFAVRYLLCCAVLFFANVAGGLCSREYY